MACNNPRKQRTMMLAFFFLKIFTERLHTYVYWNLLYILVYIFAICNSRSEDYYRIVHLREAAHLCHNLALVQGGVSVGISSWILSHKVKRCHKILWQRFTLWLRIQESQRARKIETRGFQSSTYVCDDLLALLNQNTERNLRSLKMLYDHINSKIKTPIHCKLKLVYQEYTTNA